MTYVNRRKERSERIIDVVGKKKKFITAFCHNCNEILTFRRSRIENLIPA
jgi:predicted DNA-binding transcriptional regulator YafY